MIRTKRVYEEDLGRGRRFLVERLWPRGIRRADLQMEAWLKEVGPSNELRRWFGHDPAKWEEFRERYAAELDDHPEVWRTLLEAARRGDVVLLYSSRDTLHNNAVALKEYLERQLATPRERAA